MWFCKQGEPTDGSKCECKLFKTFQAFELSATGEGLAAEKGLPEILLDLEVSTVVLRGVLGLGEVKGKQPEPCL